VPSAGGQDRPADDVERRIRAALDGRTLQVHHQPIVDLPSCRVVGTEALVRWSADDAGPPISPAEIVETAERGPLIRELGAFVLDQAVEDLARCLPDESDRVPLSINVSAAQLVDDELLEQVRDLLERGRWDPSLLCLEITETVALQDIGQAARRLAALRDLGCQVSLDDFGTGWSSLGLLRDLPIDTVKIDRSFVEHVHASFTDAVLVRSIIETAHVLGQRVCAEGVALPEQALQLTAMGCDRAQGWWFGRPLPAGPELVEAVTGVRHGLSTDRPPPLRIGERDELVVVTDDRHVVRYASAGSIPLLGVSPAVMVGQRLESFVADEIGEEGEHTVRVHHADGHPHWLRVTTQRRRVGPAADGSPREQVLWVAVDVTAAVQGQGALTTSETWFRTVFEAAPVGIAITTIDGRFVRVNAAFAAMVGRPVPELLASSYQDLSHPDDLPAARRAIEGLLAGEPDSPTVPWRYRHGEGHHVGVDLRPALLPDGQGRPAYVVVHVVPVGPPA
jgi:PAS domain S-box-containing protein